MKQEKVLVSQETAPVQFLNKDGQIENLGSVVQRVYEGEDVQRLVFASNREEKEFRLGASRETENIFVNHVEPMQVLHDHGYEQRDTVLAMGGTELFTVWENPNGQTFEDPLTWDNDIWSHRIELPGTGNLTESIIQRGSIRPGRGISFQRGFFRMICSNGLVSEVLGLGKVRFNAGNWSPSSLEEELFGESVEVLAREHMMGDRLGSRYSVNRFSGLLDTLQTVEDQDEYLATLPKFVRPMVSPFSRSPKWYLDELKGQADLFYASGLKDVHELDVANMMTNAMNRPRFGKVKEGEERVTRSPNFIVENMNSLTKAASSLIGVYSL